MLKSQGAQLIYDVLKFDTKFRSIMLYCVGTAVVCETTEAAELLAWNDGGRRYRVTMPWSIYLPAIGTPNAFSFACLCVCWFAW